MRNNLSSLVLVHLLCALTISAQEEELVVTPTENVSRGIVFPDSEYGSSEFIELDVIVGQESAPSAAIRNPPPQRNVRKSPNRQSGRYPYVDTFLQALEPFLHLDVDVSPNSFFVPDPGYNVHHHHHHSPNDVPFHPQHLPHKPPPQHRPPKRGPTHPQKQQSFKFPTEKPQQQQQQQQRPVQAQQQRPPVQRPQTNNNKHPAVAFNKPPIRLHPGSFSSQLISSFNLYCASAACWFAGLYLHAWRQLACVRLLFQQQSTECAKLFISWNLFFLFCRSEIMKKRKRCDRRGSCPINSGFYLFFFIWRMRDIRRRISDPLRHRTMR